MQRDGGQPLAVNRQLLTDRKDRRTRRRGDRDAARVQRQGALDRRQLVARTAVPQHGEHALRGFVVLTQLSQTGSASCRERVDAAVTSLVGAVELNNITISEKM